MQSIRIAGATVNQTPLDWDGNEQRLRSLLNEAKSKNIDVVCFPELCLTGYHCEDMFFSMHTARMAADMLANLLPATAGMTVLLGLPVFHSGGMFNCMALVQDQVILGLNPKKELPREGVHYESRWFQPGHHGRDETCHILGQRVPFGDIRYQLGGLGLAVEICEEAWQAESSAAHHAASGVELVLNPSASHFALGKNRIRETMVLNNSRSMQVHYVHTNLLGLEAGRIIYDGGVLIASCGEIACRGQRFGFSDGLLTWADLDLDLVRVRKMKNRSVRQAEEKALTPVIRGKDLGLVKNRQLEQPKALPVHQQCSPATEDLSPEYEFLAAEMLGLIDYLRKSRAKGYLVSLSGGCDSSSVAVLFGHAVAAALSELGAERLGRRLGMCLPENKDDPRSWIKLLLTCVYQPTRNSGNVTFDAAASLAAELGADFHKIDVDDIVESYKSRAEKSIGRDLKWENDDLALQNIQARARAPMAWILANVKGQILISTSNRSEAAVGYATMDGDTAGGLAPLGGIDKPFLRSWLKWAEHENMWGLGALAALSKVNQQAPTAELRPKSEHQDQKDETDLMPYPVLNYIELSLVRDRRAPSEILDSLITSFPSYSSGELKSWLGTFLRLWSINQWKRERYAPSFHLDDESLDPKTWCRFPILSACFEKEINEF